MMSAVIALPARPSLFELTVRAERRDPSAPTHRGRVEVTVQVPMVAEADTKLAFTVHDLRTGDTTVRWHDGRLYWQEPARGGIEATAKSRWYDGRTRIKGSYYTCSPDEACSDLRRRYSTYLLIDGRIYRQGPEPLYRLEAWLPSKRMTSQNGSYLFAANRRDEAYTAMCALVDAGIPGREVNMMREVTVHDPTLVRSTHDDTPRANLTAAALRIAKQAEELASAIAYRVEGDELAALERAVQDARTQYLFQART